MEDSSIMSLLTPGYRLSKYEVLSHIASGGMGAVYKAMDLQLGRPVALKVLDPDLAARDSVRERFQREGRHAARLSHKNIVTLYEAGEDQGWHFLALEFIQGIDLEVYIGRKGRLGPEETRRILIQAAKALDHAHQQGIVHRDIKPSNFLLAPGNHKTVVKLADMGVAHAPNADEFRVTRAGYTVGTIDYMAPEQARDSAAADIRSDIYSLGCTAYHMLAGKPPFAEGGLGERVYKHLEEPPPDLRQLRPEVSVRLWNILQRMLAKSPADRYQTPAELLVDLKQTPAVKVEESLSPVAEVEPLPRPSLNQELPDIPLADPPKQTAAESPRPVRKRQRGAARAVTPVPKALSTAAGVPRPEQAQAAARLFERACELLLETSDPAYPRELLLSCCKLDPGNVRYHKKLRELHQSQKQGLLSRWFGSLGLLALTSRLKSAQRSGEHHKVLEQGEEILAHHPADVATQLTMAESAEALGLLPLAVWLLEQGHEQAPDNTALMRALAILYEQGQQLPKALTLWEKIRTAEPQDHEAPRKINALSVRDHIARAHYSG